MGQAVFSYFQEEYHDGDVYLPEKHVELTLNDDKADTLNQLVEVFQEYVQAIGCTYAQSKQIELRPYDAEDEG